MCDVMLVKLRRLKLYVWSLIKVLLEVWLIGCDEV